MIVCAEQEYCDQENERQGHGEKANIRIKSRLSPRAYIQVAWTVTPQHCLPLKTLHTISLS